ncbi:MAG: hypothetical protein LBT38_03990 [Deltaproteobacteria bacterium]|jgi:hypothetical protein|nr:hypothetical protein [Deltaproteobacteria bacterium]
MFFFFLASFILLPLGILSFMVGWAYLGQPGAPAALWTGLILVILGSLNFMAFWRRLFPRLSKKRS